jgi:hypothetical protein
VEYDILRSAGGGGANGDGVWRGLVTIVELIDLRPYIFQPAVYGRLIYTVMYMSDRLSTEANPDLHLPPSPELRSPVTWQEMHGRQYPGVAGGHYGAKRVRAHTRPLFSST